MTVGARAWVRAHARRPRCAAPFALAWALALVACGAPAREPSPIESIDAGRLGRVGFVHPEADLSALAFVFADGSPELDAAVRALAASGIAAVEVEFEQYRRQLAASDDGCHYVVAEIEALSQRLQRQLGAARYRSPILAGVGEGGALAYAALAQAPAATIAGAVSIDPTPVLHTRVSLCAGAPATAAVDGGFRYGPVENLPGFWRVSSKTAIDPDLAALATPAREEASSLAPPLERLVALVEESVGEGPSALRDLPLTEIPASAPGDLFAVIYSGDGGWRDLDKEIGERLAAHGVPVVGVDSLRYFWRRKAPEHVAEDLAAVVETYAARWNAPHVVLVGYSFGAGVLPFAITRLPAAQRERIALVSLLGLGPRASFQFQVEAWLGAEPGAEAPEVVPEVLGLDLGRVQCFYGAEEEQTACRDPRLARAEIIETAGGHHFDGDYAALAERIYAGARKRLAPRPESSITNGSSSEHMAPSSQARAFEASSPNLVMSTTDGGSVANESPSSRSRPEWQGGWMSDASSDGPRRSSRTSAPRPSHSIASTPSAASITRSPSRRRSARRGIDLGGRG